MRHGGPLRVEDHDGVAGQRDARPFRTRGDVEGTRRAFRLAIDHARDLPLELARSHLAYGKTLAASGEEAKARTQLGAARAVFAAGGAAGFVELVDRALRTLGPDRSFDAPGLLTPAELAVARLASRRLGNSEIAEQVAISRKTVEHHLSHIYAKLGVDNRVELAQLAEAAPG